MMSRRWEEFLKLLGFMDCTSGLGSISSGCWVLGRRVRALKEHLMDPSTETFLKKVEVEDGSKVEVVKLID